MAAVLLLLTRAAALRATTRGPGRRPRAAAGRFSFALGVPLAAHSDITTGNAAHASHLLRSRSGPLAFLFTAPYAHRRHVVGADDDASPVLPSFSADAARRFAADYGLAVRAVAVRVSDAAEAFRASVAAGARPAFAPAELGHGFLLAEVELYGDAVLRFVSFPDDTDTDFLPGFEKVANSASESEQCPDFGLNRFDHIVGGVPDLAPVAAYIAGFTGFHEFDRVNGKEIGTGGESSLNGLVLANSSEHVLLTLLEPVHHQAAGRWSQIQTFLDHGQRRPHRHAQGDTRALLHGRLRAPAAAAAQLLRRRQAARRRRAVGGTDSGLPGAGREGGQG